MIRMQVCTKASMDLFAIQRYVISNFQDADVVIIRESSTLSNRRANTELYSLNERTLSTFSNYQQRSASGSVLKNRSVLINLCH